MKRKLLALAVAGVMVAPVAVQADDSTVTLTGVVNGSFDLLKAGGGKSKLAIGSNATRFQIDGKEPIGGGMAAIFSLAMDQAFAGPGSISSGPGAGGLGDLENRNSFIGLAGGWGTLRWGQNEHQYEIQQILQDPWPASENAFSALTLMTCYTIGECFTRRDPQSIWYTSPNWGGFVLDLAYITGNGIKTAGFDPKGYQVAAQYGLGGFTIYAAMAQYNDHFFTGAGLGNDKDRAMRVGVSYKAGPFAVHLSGEQLKATGGIEAKNTNYYLGGSFNMGNGQIRANYQKMGDDKADVGTLGGDSWAIGYGHALSKRTEAFIYFGNKDRDGTVSGDLKGVTFGARHTF